MVKKYYNQLLVDKKGSIDRLNYFASNIWHPGQQNPDESFKVGAKRIRDTHRELYSALIHLLISKKISRQNKINSISPETTPYNILKPIELKLQPYELRAILVQGLKNAISLQTVKNRLNRLEDAGVISRSWKKGEGVFSILINPEFLSLKCGETGKLIKNIDFSNPFESDNKESKNENLIDITNLNTKYNNKIIQNSSVDKMNVHSHISLSKKTELLEKQNQTVQLPAGSEKPETDSEENQGVNVVASQRNTDITNNKLINYKKKLANKFYELMILTFWEHLSSLYLLKLAPRNTIFYVEQSINCLITDDWYFGACKDEKQANYQYNKLIKALKSTKKLVESRKKENPRFTMDYVYPNTYLSVDAEKGKMSFKNSILHIDEYMRLHEEREMLIERQLQKERDKNKKNRFNHIITNVIAWIMSNSKENTQELLYQAAEYLRNIHPELVMKLHTDWSNTYLVKQILEKNKETGFDYDIITQCFVSQQQIKEKIDALLPEMQKRLKNQKLTIHNKLMRYFKIRGHQMRPIPRQYTKKTLSVLEYYTN